MLLPSWRSILMPNQPQAMNHHNPFIPSPSPDPMMFMLMMMLMSPGGFAGNNLMMLMFMCMMMK